MVNDEKMAASRAVEFTGRWFVQQADGTEYRIVAVAVQDDWETPTP